jgi:hypothetical protein
MILVDKTAVNKAARTITQLYPIKITKGDVETLLHTMQTKLATYELEGLELATQKRLMHDLEFVLQLIEEAEVAPKSSEFAINIIIPKHMKAGGDKK